MSKSKDVISSQVDSLVTYITESNDLELPTSRIREYSVIVRDIADLLWDICKVYIYASNNFGFRIEMERTISPGKYIDLEFDLEEAYIEIHSFGFEHDIKIYPDTIILPCDGSIPNGDSLFYTISTLDLGLAKIKTIEYVGHLLDLNFFYYRKHWTSISR